MKSFRSKPVGWRGESHRHYLAAKGIKTSVRGNLVAKQKFFFSRPIKILKPSKYENDERLKDHVEPAKDVLNESSYYTSAFVDLDGQATYIIKLPEDSEEVAATIDHEELHHVLNELEGKEASYSLDNIHVQSPRKGASLVQEFSPSTRHKQNVLASNYEAYRKGELSKEDSAEFVEIYTSLENLDRVPGGMKLAKFKGEDNQ